MCHCYHGRNRSGLGPSQCIVHLLQELLPHGGGRFGRFRCDGGDVHGWSCIRRGNRIQGRGRRVGSCCWCSCWLGFNLDLLFGVGVNDK